MYRAVFKRTNGTYRFLHVHSGQEVLDRLQREYVDLVLMDVMMPPGITGIETLQLIRETDQDVDVVMVSAMKEVKTAVSAIKLGAADYLPKPFDSDELLATVQRVFERRSLRRENAYLKITLNEILPFDDIIGESPVMRKVFQMVDLVAGSDGTALVTGESGTGKERIARAIHRRSRRGEGPFVAVNCAAIPESLLESDLFGHERGSFTGAMDRKIGKFELASGGTLFLDEIGCLPFSMQPKLLRALQEGAVERVGGIKTIPVDVRVVAATNSDLQQAIEKKTFREDLYYRLNVLPVHLPPLRERMSDIPILVAYFLKKFNEKMARHVAPFPDPVLPLFLKYSWPGNVRELENLIERIVTLNQGIPVGRQDLPPEIAQIDALEGKKREGIKGICADFERELILRVLRQARGNQTQAAHLLNIHRTTLVSRMQTLGLKPARDALLSG